MKALSIPASRSGKSVNLRAVLPAIGRKSLMKAAWVFTAVCYVSLLLDADAAMYASGIMALAAVRLAESTPTKGGDK